MRQEERFLVLYGTLPLGPIELDRAGLRERWAKPYLTMLATLGYASRPEKRGGAWVKLAEVPTDCRLNQLYKAKRQAANDAANNQSPHSAMPRTPEDVLVARRDRAVPVDLTPDGPSLIRIRRPNAAPDGYGEPPFLIDLTDPDDQQFERGRTFPADIVSVGCLILTPGSSTVVYLGEVGFISQTTTVVTINPIPNPVPEQLCDATR